MVPVPLFLTSSAFAARYSVTRATVTRWRRRGWVVVDAVGMVDVAASDERIKRYRDSNDLRRFGGRQRGAPKTSPPPLGPGAAAALASIMGTVAAPIPDAGLPAGEIEDGETVEDAAARIIALEGARATTDEARRVKENYAALLSKLQYERDAGLVVPMAHAESVLFEAARTQRNAWLNWPAKVGAIIAADLGLDADRVTTALMTYVHCQIASLADFDEADCDR